MEGNQGDLDTKHQHKSLSVLIRRAHYAETSRQNKTTCTYEHQGEKDYNKGTATLYV